MESHNALFTNLLIVSTMAVLSCMDAVKNRQRSTVTTVDVSPPCLPRRRATSSLKNLYDIEIVDEDEENDKVRIHYVGYSSEYDEWRNRSEIVVRPPQTTMTRVSSRVDSVNFSFSNLLCAIKKRLTPSREDPAIRIQLPLLRNTDTERHKV